MLQPPEVQYLRNGDVSLAYQVVGDGPIDIVEVPGVFMHLEAKWELPAMGRFLESLARFARVILFDRRGLGLSDRLDSEAAPSLAEHVDDVRAVMDAVGSRTAAILGVADGGGTAIAFAATHPERTRALVLYTTTARIRRDASFPQGWDDERAAAVLQAVEDGWGRGVMTTIMRAEEMRPFFSRSERRACTPSAAASYLRAQLDVDARPFLPTIEAPTLVMHFRDHPTFPVEGARAMAASIPGASYVEVEDGYTGEVMFGRSHLLAHMERFLTGTASVQDTDRVLAAVLFTDIVGSTERAAALGDRRWRDLLDEHDRRARGAVERAGGRIVKNTGDGLLASFDGAMRAVRCAQGLLAEASEIGLTLRAGVHVGECERRGEDLAGMTVHVAARVAALADGNEVLATSTLRDALVGADVRFEPRTAGKLRGVPGRWELFAVR